MIRPGLVVFLAACSLPLAAQQRPVRFDCGAGGDGIRLTPASVYSASTPGFDLQPPPAIAAGACASGKPFFLSVAVPDGNYRVSVTFGWPAASGTTLRRLLLKDLRLAANGTETREWTINVADGEHFDDESAGKVEAAGDRRAGLGQ